MELKTLIHNACIESLNEKIMSLNALFNDLNVGMQNDAKSTAGDKHETARAMAQIEIDKISKQLHESNLMKTALLKIDINFISDKIIQGSLIRTDKGIFYLSIALGKIIVEDIAVMVLSPMSPFGRKLIGLKVNDSVQVNATNYHIQHII